MAIKKIILLCVCLLQVNAFIFAQLGSLQTSAVNNVDALKDTLSAIADRNAGNLLAVSCESIIQVIEAEGNLSASDVNHLNEIYDVFAFSNSNGNPKSFESYLKRQRSLIISWQSPTDNQISYTWLKLPKNWDESQTYPLYVQLHGYWDVAGNVIDYLTYPYRFGPSSTYAFENGYQISPRGRGNLWYEDISETDIWECIDVIEGMFNIQQDRKYLCGHSMGGYGACNLGQKTADIWAAIGIHAGAIWWNNKHLVSDEVANRLKNTPVYFVCGDRDDLLGINEDFYSMLENKGNTDIEFVTFPGGHEYRSQDVEAMYDWMTDFVLSVNEQEMIDLYGIEIKANSRHNNVRINFNMLNVEQVQIKFIDVSGKTLKVFTDRLSAGNHEIAWKPIGVNSGIFICQIKIGSHVYNRKIML